MWWCTIAAPGREARPCVGHDLADGPRHVRLRRLRRGPVDRGLDDEGRERRHGRFLCECYVNGKGTAARDPCILRLDYVAPAKGSSPDMDMHLATFPMRAASRRFVLGLVGAVALGWLPNTAHAQFFKLCGDVDGDKKVTVTDGVQVLRAAAGLSSDCTAAICDVDVDGTITVTDGVTTLRKAAGLSIKDDCIPADGRIDSQVAYLLQFTDPLVSAILPTMLLHINETVDGTEFECDNGADGTIDIAFSDGEQDQSFSSCLIGNAMIDGEIDFANTSPSFSGVELGDARTGDTIDFDGTDGSALLGVKIEGGVKYSGRLDASPSFTRFDTTSDFLLVVQNLQVGVNGFPLGGSLDYVFNADSGVTGVQHVQVFYDGSNLAHVLVTFTDGSFKNYKFELQFLNFIS